MLHQNSDSHKNLVVKLGCWPGCFAAGFSFFSQMEPQSHGSKPYVTRKASFYAGIEQGWHSPTERCGQFWTGLCWYLLVRDSCRGHSRPNGQFLSHCLLCVKLGRIYRRLSWPLSKDDMHAWMHAPTLCIGVPAFHYVMGGGWDLCNRYTGS